jgi:hypothetical protein
MIGIGTPNTNSRMERMVISFYGKFAGRSN